MDDSLCNFIELARSVDGGLLLTGWKSWNSDVVPLTQLTSPEGGLKKSLGNYSVIFNFSLLMLGSRTPSCTTLLRETVDPLPISCKVYFGDLFRDVHQSRR